MTSANHISPAGWTSPNPGSADSTHKVPPAALMDLGVSSELLRTNLNKAMISKKENLYYYINHRTLWNLVLNTAFRGLRAILLPPTFPPTLPIPQLYHILEQDPHPGRGLLLLHQYFHFLQNILYNHVLLLPTESNLKITIEIIHALNWTLIEPLSGLVVQVLSDSCQQP